MAANNLKHARRNHELAEKLLQEGDFYDWVVTVAYYACNHYMRFHLFPLEDHGLDNYNRSIDDIDQYCHKKGLNDKHKTLVQLFAEKNGNKIHAIVSNLLNDCNTARYYDYETPKELAERAVSTMKSLSKLCSSKRGKRKRMTKKRS